MSAARAPVATVDHLVDWGDAFHDPPSQANDRIRIAVGVATVWDVLDAAVLRPPLAPASQGNGERLYVTAIGGVAQNPDTGHYWVYLVDGNEPPVGPDAFVLRGGERIVWSYVHC